jgi:hypothetical protein
MKKALVITLSALFVLACLVTAAWFYLPTLAFRMMGKAIGGSVNATQTSVNYKNGILDVLLTGMQVKGKVEGRIGRCELKLDPSKGIYLTYVAVSDFDVTLKGKAGPIGFLPVPVELAEIRNGLLVYEGKKYTVRELRVSNFNTGKAMEFDIDAGVEGLGNLKTHGQGFFNDTHSDIKGDYNLTGINIARILKDYEGVVDSKGSFSYKDERLVMDGEAEAPRFLLWEKFLNKPLVSENNRCRIHLAMRDKMFDVVLEGLSFRGAPLALKFRADDKKLIDLALTVDFLPIGTLAEYINLARFSGKDWAPLSYVHEGDVRIDSLIYSDKLPLRARFDLRGGSGGEGKYVFRDVEGTLALDGEVFTLSGLRGRFGEGSISDVSGVVPLKGDHDLRIKGKYALGLKDLGTFAGVKDVEAVGGATEGTMELKGRQDKGFFAEGSGIVSDGAVVWRGMRFGASGSYAFKDRAIAFDRLLISGAKTRLVASGRAEAGFVSVAVNGTVDGRQIGKLFLRQYPMDGYMAVDGTFEVRDKAFSASGSVNMTELSFEIPGVMTKGPGIEGLAEVSLKGQQGGEISVDDLNLTMGGMKARASGNASKRRISNVHLVLDVPRIERSEGLFFFSRIKAQGNLLADVRLDDVRLPLTCLPDMRGSLSVKGGGVHLPGMVNPLTDIDLSCTFSGDKFDLDVTGLRVGTSKLAAGHLALSGLDAPQFALTLEMERLDPHDLASREARRLRIPVIPEGSLMSRAKGTVHLKARRLTGNGLAGRDLFLDGAFADRTIVVNQAGMTMSPGSVAVQGSVRLAGDAEIDMTGELKGLTAQEAFSLFGAGTDNILEGTGFITGALKLRGRDAEELASGAEGTVRIASRNGVVRKWNLISKLLAVTNLYDLFRGRVDLTKEGLAYRRLGASLEGHNGVFHTTNFFIDSPSMIITGAGDVNAASKTIDGKMTVSPLVTMDRLISWIPLLRDIVKEKKQGFIFFVYDVKGPLSDPEITSSYVQSVGRRAFNILWNTLKLPKEIVDQLPKDLFPRELFEQ